MAQTFDKTKTWVFAYKNIEISLGYKDEIVEGNKNAIILAYLSNRDNKIHYDKINPETERYETVYSETYEKALRKLTQRSAKSR